MDKSERTVLAIGAGVVIIAIIAAAVALIVGEDDPATFPEGSPEAALQQYVEVVRSADRDAALALLTPAAQARVKDDDFFPNSFCGETDGRRVRVTATTIDGENATVTLTIQESNSSVFDFDQYEYNQSVPMQQIDGRWLVDDPYVCF